MTKEIIVKYKPKTVADMQNAINDIFGPMFVAILNRQGIHKDIVYIFVVAIEPSNFDS